MEKTKEENVRELQKHVSDVFNVEQKKVQITVQRDRLKLPPNIMVFQAFAYLAATKLKPATNQVLMFLFSKSVYENYISMDVKTISEELNISERSIISSINELVENCIVIKIKHPSDKRRNDYFINPIAAWKGNSFTRASAMKSIDKAQLKLFNPDDNNSSSNTEDPLIPKIL